MKSIFSMHAICESTTKAHVDTVISRRWYGQLHPSRAPNECYDGSKQQVRLDGGSKHHAYDCNDDDDWGS